MDRDDRHKHDRDRDRRSGEIITGELWVRGESFIEIELGRTHPDKVEVRFKDQPDHTPCNPHRDCLDYKVFHTRGRYVLFITWNVSGLRELQWTVIF